MVNLLATVRPELPAPSPSLERILDQATHLFAEQGYHGTSTRQIAAAAGLNIATVHHHVGTKRDLYLRVIERLCAEDRAMIDAWLSEWPAGAALDAPALRDVLLRLLDRLIDRMREHPERVRLYLRRWLEPRDELTETESELSLELYVPVMAVIDDARSRGVVRLQSDAATFLRSVDWLLYGYFVAGPMDRGTLRGDPADSASLENFQAFMREYLCRMLGL
jgi:AcrR family transcriptional regulator